MALNVGSILDSVVSHAMTLGVFETVNQHEAINPPGNGYRASVWIDSIAPVPGASGLNSTTVRLAYMLRIYTAQVLSDPDAMDPGLVAATDALMAEYTGDFDLNGTIRNVDLLGEGGVPLSAQAGYLNMDGKIYRVMTITLPLIVNDLWTQVV